MSFVNNPPTIADEGKLSFSDEEGGADARQLGDEVWHVLIVDDDPDVHTSTALAFFNLEILGRPLHFFHARSASEAQALLAEKRDMAAVMLDVVMEDEHAGLELVKVLRDKLGLVETRIILRTGQPGYAPELDAVRDYDINDYLIKSELTRTKLITAVTTAIRSYAQICTINTSRRGLEFIVRSGTQQVGVHDLQSFASAIISQVVGLLRLTECQQSLGEMIVAVSGTEAEGMALIAVAGRYQAWVNECVSAIPDPGIVTLFERCLAQRRSIYEESRATLFFGSGRGRDVIFYMETARPLSQVERELCEVFCCVTSAGLDNVSLYSQLFIFAFLDPLTGLPNRRRFLTMIEERLRSVGRATQMLALVDIDHFGETNDALGPHFGDQLIQAVAARLVAVLGNEVIVARTAADVFGLFGDARALEHGALFEIFARPFTLEQHRLLVSVSMGLVRLAETDGTPADALKEASIALKHAKQHRRGNYHYFTESMGAEIVDRVMLLQALCNTFENGRLELFYQPQIDLATGRPVGAEALLRWRIDEDNFIPPTRFIPLAEYSGLIIQLGKWVLQKACLEQVRLARLGFADFRMAVNVSVCQFRDPGFVEMLQRVVNETGANPACLELEITESVAMDDVEFMIATLDKVKSIGITVSVDDFGTGYSSLSQLQRLRLDRLKIDKSFIHGIAASERGISIADMMIRLGRALGLRVLAEGVESEQQAMLLRQLHCHEAQGYLYCKPMPAERHLEWLQRNTSAEA